MKKAVLSKSTFLRGLKCHKNLYLYKNFYHLKDEISASQQAIFDQGTNVGELAQGLFPDGVDASPSDYFKMQESVFKTKEFIDQGESVIYEATFQFNDVIAAMDILVKDDDGWKAYEVKSSTEVKDVYIKDVAIQYYTIVNSEIELVDISIIYINNQYVKNGPIDIKQLFNIQSVRDQVLALQADIPIKIDEFKDLIEQPSIPEVDIGPHCFEPYGCDFMGYCWKQIPDYSIFNIANLRTNKKFELYEEGIITFDQIDLDNNPLNGKQLMQVTSELDNSIHIDKENIGKFLSDLNYPLYFLDFETINPAVPIYDNSRPYQQMVFQYSLHVQKTPEDSLEHYEYLADASSKIDPRDLFIENLIGDLGKTGDILVYNIAFEKGRLNSLLNLYTEYHEQISDIINRLKDLMVPFQKKWYYKPEMRGSHSIKQVLPALVPNLSYNDLEIKEGGTASSIFVQMVQGTFKGDLKKTRKDLLEYCKMDTYAMVKILEALYKI